LRKKKSIRERKILSREKKTWIYLYINETDWFKNTNNEDKVMNYNYIKFIKEREIRTRKNTPYISRYDKDWKDWPWYYDPDFRKDYDYLQSTLTEQIWQ
jgi:hypothetical protein